MPQTPQGCCNESTYSMAQRKPISAFIRESNRIEGIIRQPRKAEILEHERLMSLGKVTVGDLVPFVMVYQPGARLRDQVGLNVRVGNHLPPHGGPEIARMLGCILDDANANRRPEHAYRIHCDYETLHPFTDGNG